MWAPDGSHVTFTSFDLSTAVGHLAWQDASGAGGIARLAESSHSRPEEGQRSMPIHELRLALRQNELLSWRPT